MSSTTPLLNSEGYNNKTNVIDDDDTNNFNDQSFSYINFQNNEKKANSLFKKALLIMIGIFILFEVILSTITLTPSSLISTLPDEIIIPPNITHINDNNNSTNNNNNNNDNYINDDNKDE